MLRQARRRAPTALLRQASFLHSGYEEGRFDCVLQTLALHELPGSELPQALTETTRICRPGGTIIILEFHRSCPPPIRQRLQHHLWEHHIEEFYRLDLATRLPEELNLERRELLLQGRLQLLTVRRRETENGRSHRLNLLPSTR